MSTVTPVADTARSWALFPHGLLVFERADPAASHLLVSQLETCTTRGCECRDIALRAIEVVADDSFDPAVLSSDALLAKFTAEAMEARLDIDTGNLAPDDDGRVPLSAEWIRYLQSQIDGELLDVLHEKWLNTKGMRSVPKSDWEPRPPGDLVGWYEAHPSDRPDVYLDDDGAFIAEDLFCVRPTCTCDEAVIAFAPAKIASAPDVGSIRLRISTLDVVERRVEANNAALLDRLWHAFAERHRRLTTRLSERNKQMVELASDHVRRRAPVRSTPQTGRNAPCPCGSGKKYKRCCG